MSNQSDEAKSNVRNLRLTKNRIRQLQEQENNPLLQDFRTKTGKWQISKLFDFCLEIFLTSPETFMKNELFAGEQSITSLFNNYMQDQEKVNTIQLRLFEDLFNQLQEIKKLVSQNYIQEPESSSNIFNRTNLLRIDQGIHKEQSNEIKK